MYVSKFLICDLICNNKQIINFILKIQNFSILAKKYVLLISLKSAILPSLEC